jgi:hypothetical protein
MYHSVALLPEDEEVIPEGSCHRFDPQVARRWRMIGWLGSQEFVDVFSPEDRDTSTKELVPTDWLLGVNQVVECSRVVRRQKGSAWHPVFKARHVDIQDDIVVVGAFDTDDGQLAQGSHSPREAGWVLALKKMIDRFKVIMAARTVRGVTRVVLIDPGRRRKNFMAELGELNGPFRTGA